MKSRSLAEPALSEKQKQILRSAQNDSEGLGMTNYGETHGSRGTIFDEQSRKIKLNLRPKRR